MTVTSFFTQLHTYVFCHWWSTSSIRNVLVPVECARTLSRCCVCSEFEWKFMTTHNWNEGCEGDWVLWIQDQGPDSRASTNRCKSRY